MSELLIIDLKYMCIYIIYIKVTIVDKKKKKTSFSFV